uniref:Uncharacterized protein n=1 Tax=Plectus sambesii TaxID=2011161 RepID=A0A914VK69_9BILA
MTDAMDISLESDGQQVYDYFMSCFNDGDKDQA